MAALLLLVPVEALVRGANAARHGALVVALRACAAAGDEPARALLAQLPLQPPPPATIALALGSFLHAAAPRADYLLAAVPWALRAAARARPLLAVRYEELWEQPLDDVRALLRFEPAPALAHV